MLKRITAISAILMGSAVQADPAEISGYVGVELNYFPDTGLYPGQLQGTQSSIVIAPKLWWRSESGDTRASLEFFGRLDSKDNNRTHYDLREAYVKHDFGELDILVGVNKVFWGVAESRHVVDVINQYDLLEYTDTDSRLGQPMIEISTDQDWGNLSGYIMSGFREISYPGEAGRFQFGLPVDENATTWGDSDEEMAPDYALRYYNSFGGVDLGLSAFYGTSREPKFTPNATGTAFNPYYGRIWQTGIDVQYTADAALWKLEAISRDSDDFDRFTSVAAGLEYTFYQVFASDGDFGVIAEYLYDNRGADAPQNIFQRDVFIGGRWGANDSQDTSALIGAVIDVEDQTTVIRLEFERRLEIGALLKVRGQLFTNIDATNPVYGFRQDSFLSVALEKHF